MSFIYLYGLPLTFHVTLALILNVPLTPPAPVPESDVAPLLQLPAPTLARVQKMGGKSRSRRTVMQWCGTPTKRTPRMEGKGWEGGRAIDMMT